MRRLKIVFHVGKQKTATTYIQKNIRSNEKLIFLGKFISNGNDKNSKNKFLGEINNLHYLLFQKHPNAFKNNLKNPTKNNYFLILKYAKEIVSIIEKKSEIEQLIISDECISDYYNYLGELNLFLIVAMGNLVSSMLKNKVEVSKVLSFTIRNQFDILKSFYCYSPLINESFKDFINKTFNKKYSDFSGSLFYYEVFSMLSNVVNEDWKIKLTPFEILSIDENPIKFIRESLDINPEISSCISNKNLAFIFNKSSNETTNGSFLVKQHHTIFFQLGNSISSEIEYNNLVNKYFKIKYIFLRYIVFLLFFIDKVIIKLFSKLLLRKYPITDLMKDLINQTYREDNKLLNNLLKYSNLKKYGYFY